jgi:hypothetical protein
MARTPLSPEDYLAYLDTEMGLSRLSRVLAAYVLTI